MSKVRVWLLFDQIMSQEIKVKFTISQPKNYTLYSVTIYIGYTNFSKIVKSYWGAKLFLLVCKMNVILYCKQKCIIPLARVLTLHFCQSCGFRCNIATIIYLRPFFNKSINYYWVIRIDSSNLNFVSNVDIFKRHNSYVNYILMTHVCDIWINLIDWFIITTGDKIDYLARLLKSIQNDVIEFRWLHYYSIFAVDYDTQRSSRMFWMSSGFLVVTAFMLSAVNGADLNEPSIGTKIVNGKNSTRGQFPFYAFLKVQLNGMNGSCGGSLISNEWVVSVAHCLQKASSVEVHLGSLRASNLTEEGRVILNVNKDRIYVHPQYNPDKFLKYVNIKTMLF